MGARSRVEKSSETLSSESGGKGETTDEPDLNFDGKSPLPAVPRLRPIYHFDSAFILEKSLRLLQKPCRHEDLVRTVRQALDE